MPSTDEPGRYLVTESGEKKSPQTLKHEYQTENADKKGLRFAKAMQAQYGPYAPSEIETLGNMRDTEWKAVTDKLKQAGELKETENPPDNSVPFIQKYLRQLNDWNQAQGGRDQ